MYVAKIEPRWFYVGQIIFMIWNSVNDPLFGWMSDRMQTFSFRKNSRLGAIRYGGWPGCCLSPLCVVDPRSR